MQTPHCIELCINTTPLGLLADQIMHF